MRACPTKPNAYSLVPIIFRISLQQHPFTLIDVFLASFISLTALSALMAELFGLGASAIAFIGLAGQILQGCQYVRDLIDNIRDAPDNLRHYHTEIASFRSAVLGFQEVLQAIKPFARIENSAEQALLALQSGGAIDDLKAFLQNFERSREKELWRSIKLARKRSKLAKYIARLGEAKANILLAQSQVNL
jgi:hypothetical protein